MPRRARCYGFVKLMRGCANGIAIRDRPHAHMWSGGPYPAPLAKDICQCSGSTHTRGTKEGVLHAAEIARGGPRTHLQVEQFSLDAAEAATLEVELAGLLVTARDRAPRACRQERMSHV